MLERFTSVQPVRKRVGQRRKRLSRWLSSRCSENGSDVEGTEPAGVRLSRSWKRDATMSETYVASIAQREGRTERRELSSIRPFFSFPYIGCGVTRSAVY